LRAVVTGGIGREGHGTDRQVGIAGGVGVAPFLSWLRALKAPLPYRVDFFYTAVGKPAFADEIHQIADRFPALNAHLIDTSRTGRLTTEQILTTVGGDPHELSVFMCGPAGMLSTFQTQLRVAGVPGRRIHRKYFDWR
jgi:predicted ferric reductase